MATKSCSSWRWEVEDAAAGLGNAPPSADAFRDLEPRYAKQLADYSSELLQELQGRLGELVR